jgi:hypothetical protein
MTITVTVAEWLTIHGHSSENQRDSSWELTVCRQSSNNQHDSCQGLTVHRCAGHSGLAQDCPRTSQDILDSLLDVRLLELLGGLSVDPRLQVRFADEPLIGQSPQRTGSCKTAKEIYRY